MRTLNVLATLLVVIGALNWGLVGLFRLDLVAAVFGMRFGEVSPAGAVVYALVGLAGLYKAFIWGTAERHTGAHSHAGV